MVSQFLQCLFKPSDFTCGICFETLPPNNKFKKKKCSHPYCTNCIKLYVETAANDKKYEIKCPSPNCHKFLKPLSCREILCPSMFNLWCDNLFDSVLLSLRTVYCPYEDCSKIILNECNDFVTLANCPHCNRDFCYKCNIKWHEGVDCKGVKKSKEDVMFDDIMYTKRWKRCPRCGQSISKIYGCSYVKCRCGQPFCYSCGAKFGRSHNCYQTKLEEFKQY